MLCANCWLWERERFSSILDIEVFLHSRHRLTAGGAVIACGLRAVTRTQTRFLMPQVKEQQLCCPIQQLDLTDLDSIANPTTDFREENRIGKVLLRIHSIIHRAELSLGTGLPTSSEVPYEGKLPFQQI